MERFASVPSCRRTSLLNYFNETYPEKSCGGCDYCTGEFQRVDATREAQMILSAIARTGGKFGAIHICDIVCGANTAKIRQFDHHTLKTYGVGKDHPKTYWRSLLDALMAEGQLKQSHDQFPVPQLTDTGTELMFGREEFHINEDTRVEPEKASSRRDRSNNHTAQIDCHEGLFEHLRSLRKEVADASKVPPYVVFSDRSLRAIAAHMPENEEEFLCLHGIGEKKFQNYGDKFTQALHDFLTENPEVKAEKQPLPPSNPRRETTIKRGISTTVLDTYQLIQKGLPLEEIAKLRGFANSTIETHIAKLIEEGKQIDQHQFVTKEQFQLCSELFSKHGDEALAPIIEAAHGKLGYGHAKIVRAFIALDHD